MNAKYPPLIAGFLTLSFALMIAVAGVQQNQDIRSKAADPTEGQLIIDPASFNGNVGTPIPISIKVNVGATNALNIVKYTMSFDPSILKVNECIPGAEFGSVFEQQPCTIDNLAGTVSVLQQAAPAAGKTDGPTGIVTLTTMSLEGISDGVSSLTIDPAHELVVKDLSQTDGTAPSLMFTPTSNTGGEIVIGSGSALPTADPIITQDPSITILPPQETTPPIDEPVPTGTEVIPTIFTTPGANLPPGQRDKLDNIRKLILKIIARLEALLNRLDTISARLDKQMSKDSFTSRRMNASKKKFRQAFSSANMSVNRFPGSRNRLQAGGQIIRDYQSAVSALREYHQSLTAAVQSIKADTTQSGQGEMPQQQNQVPAEGADDDDSSTSGSDDDDQDGNETDDDDQSTTNPIPTDIIITPTGI